MRWVAGVAGIVIAVAAWRLGQTSADDRDAWWDRPKWQRALGFLAVGLLWGCWMYALQGDAAFLLLGPLAFAPLYGALMVVIRRFQRRAPTVG